MRAVADDARACMDRVRIDRTCDVIATMISRTHQKMDSARV
jgi:hypothetical protein